MVRFPYINTIWKHVFFFSQQAYLSSSGMFAVFVSNFSETSHFLFIGLKKKKNKSYFAELSEEEINVLWIPWI